MTHVYSSSLTAEKISGIAERYGFADRLSVEKFIMDFAMHHHIVQQVECVTRGGMCMPFYLPKTGVRRLSVDIDLLTHRTVDEIKSAMSNVNRAMPDVRCTEYEPKAPYPIDNLISYRVSYDSCLGGKQYVKVDFFCGVKIPLSS